MQSSLNLDQILVLYPSDTNVEGQFSRIITNMLQGQFKTNLHDQFCKEVLSTKKLKSTYEESLKSNIEDKLDGVQDLNRVYDVLSIGISSLQLFVQINWTGPSHDCKHDPPLQYLRKYLTDDCSESEWLEKLSAELALDGETVAPNINNLELLLVAKAVLSANVFENIVSASFWRLRCMFIHQQVLEERSPSLYSEMGSLLKCLSVSELVNESLVLTTQLKLEAACMWLFYGHVARADEEITSACKLLGLEVELVGALGKRTKFQQKELPQLTLSVNIEGESVDNEGEAVMGTESKGFPKDVRLEDDVRLDKIAFSDASVTDIPAMTARQQAAVLAKCMHEQKSKPKDRLHAEEILPYLTCLTSQPRVWSLQMSALLQRSKLDSEHRRTAERAMMQFQSLSDSVASEDPPVMERLEWVYACYLPPAWRLQEFLAHTYLSLGMVQTALDVFLDIQLWEEVIVCYNLLKLRHKAAEVIRQELEKKPSVKLLCLLGDATDDVDCYRQAWELSQERSGRAQRHWGMYYFTRKQYAESIPHLEKSLSLNSLQETLWFRLGFAALMEENWSVCASAYRRYCSLEPESFEAWNNLAKAYVKTGQKARAFRALQEAVKCNYENWRVWDNLMAVSTDCAQFEEVIRCYHRILDLNEKHVDSEVLKILTNVVVRNIQSADNCSTPQLRKLSLKLFGRLTSQVLNNATVWQLYAQVAASDEPSADNTAKVAQCLQKAYRAATQGSWERDLATCLEVTDVCVDLAKAYIECSQNCGSSNEKIQMLSSAKLPLKSVLTKIEKEQTDLITGELPESLTTKYKALLTCYEQIIDETQSLINS